MRRNLGDSFSEKSSFIDIRSKFDDLLRIRNQRKLFFRAETYIPNWEK